MPYGHRTQQSVKSKYNRNPNRIKIERKSVLVSKFIRYYFYRCQFEHNARVQLIPHNLKYNPIKSVIVSTCWYLNQLAKSFGVGTYGKLWVCSRFHRIVSILCVIHVGFIRNRYSVLCYGCRILQANNHTWCRMSSRQNSTNDRSYIVCLLENKQYPYTVVICNKCFPFAGFCMPFVYHMMEFCVFI